MDTVHFIRSPMDLVHTIRSRYYTKSKLYEVHTNTCQLRTSLSTGQHYPEHWPAQSPCGDEKSFRRKERTPSSPWKRSSSDANFIVFPFMIHQIITMPVGHRYDRNVAPFFEFTFSGRLFADHISLVVVPWLRSRALADVPWRSLALVGVC